MKKYKGLVIGGGLAGAVRPEGNHAQSFQEHPQCQLAGILDTDQSGVKEVSKKYTCAAYETLDAALGEGPDIVSLAVHPEHRGPYLERICRQNSVRAIYCEKPLAYTAKEAQQIVSMCHEAGKKIYINYQRRANKTYHQLQSDIQSGKRGKLQSAILYYMRGMWANASHYVDLSLMLFGQPRWVFAHDNPIPSPYEKDGNATMILGYPECHVLLVPLLSWDKGFYAGDHELIFEKERLYIPNISFYETTDVKYQVAQGYRLVDAPVNLTLHKDDNDYLPFLERIVEDLDQAAGAEWLNPVEAAWSVHILEKADESRAGGQSVHLSF